MPNPLGFKSEIGQYKNPDVVVPANGPMPPAPAPLLCPGGTLVIYAADIAIVANCAGFAGFAGGNPWTNPVAMGALARAAAFIPKVTCQGNQCSKVASLIWIGWDCGGNNPRTAVAAAEIHVECVLPQPGDITAFKDACRGLGELPAPIFLGQGWSPSKKKNQRRKKKARRR
ncbi:MAG TPA: hypothetical protein VEU32_20190 [Burkholderiales bacterium]|nr:hypothetical protein [Burkholderiales bacterium]